MNSDDILRLKNFLLCTWLGLLYGICGVAIAKVNWTVFFLIVLTVSVSAYLHVGRAWLERIAPVILFVSLLGLVELFPTAQEWRAFAHNPIGWLRPGSG